jgi:putative membrane protein
MWRVLCGPFFRSSQLAQRGLEIDANTLRFGGLMNLHRVPVLVVSTVAMSLAALAAQGQVRVTTSSGEVVMLTQKNVVDHMIVGDSIEVEMAQLAAMRTQNTAVKDFANLLVTDHRKHLDNLRKLAGKGDIGREANATDTSGAQAARIFGQLQSMAADSGFDRSFIREQIQHHQREIDGLKMLRPAAKDDDLQHDIDRTMPILQQHLSRAKAVAAQLGMPSDTIPTKPPQRS